MLESLTSYKTNDKIANAYKNMYKNICKKHTKILKESNAMSDAEFFKDIAPVYIAAKKTPYVGKDNKELSKEMLSLIDELNGFRDYHYPLTNKDHNMIVQYVIHNPYNIKNIKQKFELISDEDDEADIEKDIDACLQLGKFDIAIKLLKNGEKINFDEGAINEVLDEVIERDYPVLLDLILKDYAKSDEDGSVGVSAADYTDNAEFWKNLLNTAIKFRVLSCFRIILNAAKDNGASLYEMFNLEDNDQGLAILTLDEINKLDPKFRSYLRNFINTEYRQYKNTNSHKADSNVIDDFLKKIKYT